MPIINEKDKEGKVLELTGHIVLQNERGIQISETSARIVLNQESFFIFPENLGSYFKRSEKQDSPERSEGGSYLFSYREVLSLIPADHRLKLSFGGGKELQIFQLGYQYEDFVRVFIKLRNEMLLKDFLFQETLKKSGLEADFMCLDKSGLETQRGKAEFRFYQTSLVILPERGELMRIPLSDILETKTDNFQIEILAEESGKITISKLGGKFDLFKETLSGCLNEISLNIQNFIKGIWPEIDFLTLNKISRLIKEGKAASKQDIEAVSLEFWQKLEARLMKTGVKEEYEFLKSIGEPDKIYIGFKKGLMGALTGDYFWFFIPIYSEDKLKAGNAIAFETAGEKETGRATYFFRIVSREEYRETNKAKIDGQIDDLISKINRGLTAINFRREPIYLPEEKLEEPEYVKYKFSMVKIPEIKLMRELFIGRVIHRDNEQWQEDVKNLLQFNISCGDDATKWQKIEETAEKETESSQENGATEELKRGREAKGSETGDGTIK